MHARAIHNVLTQCPTVAYTKGWVEPSHTPANHTLGKSLRFVTEEGVKLCQT